MEPYQNLFKKSNYHHLALLVVLILYSVLNIQTPSMLANLIDNIYGNIVIIIAAFYLFAHCHPIVVNVLTPLSVSIFSFFSMGHSMAKNHKFTFSVCGIHWGVPVF